MLEIVLTSVEGEAEMEKLYCMASRNCLYFIKLISFKLILGTQTKNIPTLDEVDEVETVSNCHAMQLSHFCFYFHSGQNYLRHNYQ